MERRPIVGVELGAANYDASVEGLRPLRQLIFRLSRAGRPVRLYVNDMPEVMFELVAKAEQFALEAEASGGRRVTIVPMGGNYFDASTWSRVAAEGADFINWRNPSPSLFRGGLDRVAEWILFLRKRYRGIFLTTFDDEAVKLRAPEGFALIRDALPGRRPAYVVPDGRETDPTTRIRIIPRLSVGRRPGSTLYSNPVFDIELYRGAGRYVLSLRSNEGAVGFAGIFAAGAGQLVGRKVASSLGADDALTAVSGHVAGYGATTGVTWAAAGRAAAFGGGLMGPGLAVVMTHRELAILKDKRHTARVLAAGEAARDTATWSEMNARPLSMRAVAPAAESVFYRAWRWSLVTAGVYSWGDYGFGE